MAPPAEALVSDSEAEHDEPPPGRPRGGLPACGASDEEEASTDLSDSGAEDGFSSGSDWEPRSPRVAYQPRGPVPPAGGSAPGLCSPSESESEEEEGRERRVRFCVVAPTEAGDNAVVLTLPLETPMERLMLAWCRHHGLPPDSARFLLGGHELSPEETPLALGIRSLIPEHLVGVTPLNGDIGSPSASHRAKEVRMVALPRRRRGAPPLVRLALAQ